LADFYGSHICSEWNTSHQRIWKGKLAADAIKAELDTLQTSIKGLVRKTGYDVAPSCLFTLICRNDSASQRYAEVSLSAF
jgi:hypothetical protein